MNQITEQLELELERLDAGYAAAFHPQDYSAVLEWHTAEFSRYSRLLMSGDLSRDAFLSLTNRLNAHLRAYADQFARARSGTAFRAGAAYQDDKPVPKKGGFTRAHQV